MSSEIVNVEPGTEIATTQGMMNLVDRTFQEIMQKGQDYGTVPGCGSKPVLFQPGAQKIAMVLGWVPSYEWSIVDGNGGNREYTVTARLEDRRDGSKVGEGLGSCSTAEKGGWGKKGRPWEVYNTVLKMAKKRAYVDAVLTACGGSWLFTQDIGDPERVEETETLGQIEECYYEQSLG
jgi:hypothetical protein